MCPKMKVGASADKTGIPQSKEHTPYTNRAMVRQMGPLLCKLFSMTQAVNPRTIQRPTKNPVMTLADVYYTADARRAQHLKSTRVLVLMRLLRLSIPTAFARPQQE
mmetsp:Transcript_92967/g.184573  ORF Transcript_92967/g.184573 Transcript_92967/m.184573 type:complete len:106 (-) Transcript_92967:979-1296(-)